MGQFIISAILISMTMFQMSLVRNNHNKLFDVQSFALAVAEKAKLISVINISVAAAQSTISLDGPIPGLHVT